MRNLTELNELEEYLKAEGIPYERVDVEPVEPVKDKDYSERHQIIVPANDGRWEWDAICHKGSYGCEAGLLEIMGTIVRDNAGDSVEGWLTAEDVIERIKEKYFQK